MKDSYFQVTNPWKHIGKCLFASVIYLGLVVVWILTDNHRAIEIDSNEQYNQDTDTFFIVVTKDCTSDHFIQWAPSLISALVVPMFLFIIFIISNGKIRNKANSCEKFTILALINIVAIFSIVLFAVLLANSLVVQKIIISLACLIVSISNAITLKIRNM